MPAETVTADDPDGADAEVRALAKGLILGLGFGALMWAGLIYEIWLA